MARKPQPQGSETPSLFGEEECPAQVVGCPGLPADLPPSWLRVLGSETRKPYWASLMAFLATERASHPVLPPEPDVFNAFHFTPLDRVEVVLLGQDPYPTPGVPHGLCFSVRPGAAVPASLRNMYRELQDDLGIRPSRHGDLRAWAQRGVLLLNACLTVRAGTPNAHSRKGWEQFTDAAIRAINDRERPIVFLLWGSYAQKKEKLIDTGRHVIIKGVHPSPLSADKGFFGSKPFSRVNAALEAAGRNPIDWQLPEAVTGE